MSFKIHLYYNEAIGNYKHLSVYMNEQAVKEQLSRFNLSEIEIEIYLFLLKNGPKTPLEVSRGLTINRTKIYRLIEILLLKNIIERVGSERGLKIKASPPQNLQLLILSEEEKIKESKNMFPSLVQSLSSLSANTQEPFEVMSYQGVEGLKQMLWNELKAKEILVFGYENTNQFVGKKFADKFREEVVARNITLKEIGNSPTYKHKDQSFYNSAAGWGKVYCYKQIPESVLKIRHQFVIYNSTFATFNWKDTKTGMEVINAPLADMQRQNFLHYWGLAK